MIDSSKYFTDIYQTKEGRLDTKKKCNEIYQTEVEFNKKF